MTDCLFCKMVAGEIKPDVIYETDDVLAFGSEEQKRMPSPLVRHVNILHLYAF